ncbi:CAP domain-containing protein [Psychrobacter sp. W2-37-MNA-CIBAN-0211]|uniref:CAP domain-containing protein n=1 Tax=Psychrobacter sp. W2-37-MNA-CIBAN-0211 TaxID=3140443 RepID=UPI0033347C3F
MTANTPQKNLAAVLFLTVFLTACGGGGDSDSSSTSNDSPTELQEEIISEPITSIPVTATPDDQDNEPNDDVPVNTSNEPTENNAQAALSANNQFGLARTSCGLGGLSADTALDDIAIRHANYIKYVFANSTPTSFNAHIENEISDIASVTGTNNPFFGGLDFSDRLSNANYRNAQYGATENIAQSVYYSSAGDFLSVDTVAISMAKSLLAAPYHLRSLMLPTSSLVGTGMVTYKPSDKNTTNNQGYVLVSNASATKASADNTFSGVFTYPCQGVTGTVTALYNETPNPVEGTGRNLRTDPIGQPVYISMPSAQKIKVSNINFRDTQRNADVPIQLIDFDNDPYTNTNYALPANEAFILPLTDALKSCEIKRAANQSQQCGLYGNTKYQVSFDILVDNKTLQNKSFTFTTGKVNY